MVAPRSTAAGHEQTKANHAALIYFQVLSLFHAIEFEIIELRSRQATSWHHHNQSNFEVAHDAQRRAPLYRRLSQAALWIQAQAIWVEGS